MKHPVRVAILVLISALLLIVAGWAVTLVLFKSGGGTEQPQEFAQFSR